MCVRACVPAQQHSGSEHARCNKFILIAPPHTCRDKGVQKGSKVLPEPREPKDPLEQRESPERGVALVPMAGQVSPGTSDPMGNRAFLETKESLASLEPLDTL